MRPCDILLPCYAGTVVVSWTVRGDLAPSREAIASLTLGEVPQLSYSWPTAGISVPPKTVRLGPQRCRTLAPRSDEKLTTNLGTLFSGPRDKALSAPLSQPPRQQLDYISLQMYTPLPARFPELIRR